MSLSRLPLPILKIWRLKIFCTHKSLLFVVVSVQREVKITQFFIATCPISWNNHKMGTKINTPIVRLFNFICFSNTSSISDSMWVSAVMQQSVLAEAVSARDSSPGRSSPQLSDSKSSPMAVPGGMFRTRHDSNGSVAGRSADFELLCDFFS